ncbi:MAG: DUF2924 domain-containing protein [Paracoccaceae bacterium]
MDDLTKRIAEIETWDRDQCLEAWYELVGEIPGSRLSLRFLRKALIHEMQCKELCGLTLAVRRTLKASAPLEKPTNAQAFSSLPTGTQLVREWNGRVYRVNVKADGFEMDGQMFSSLSAVAKHITGAEWSGPRFFGLKKKRAA